MDRGTRKDLLETIEKQKDQLGRYEGRLRGWLGNEKQPNTQTTLVITRAQFHRAAKHTKLLSMKFLP